MITYFTQRLVHTIISITIFSICHVNGQHLEVITNERERMAITGISTDTMSDTNTGVYGEGGAFGMRAIATSSFGRGLYAFGNSIGIQVESRKSAGVIAIAQGSGYGIDAISYNGAGAKVRGREVDLVLGGNCCTEQADDGIISSDSQYVSSNNIPYFIDLLYNC